MISKILLRIEGVAARLQGKGWGAGTVAKEFGACVSLLGHKDVALCVDIGANKGTYTTEICRTFPDAKVVAFEPTAVNLQALNEKFADNTSVFIEPYAVSKDDGEATLFSNTAGSGLASLTKRRLDHYNISFENTETIRTIVFEDYWITNLERAHIDICKIDIEGHELDALGGFGEALDHIDIIQFEFGGCNIDTRTFFQDFWYFFTERSFELFRVSPLGPLKIKEYREIDETFATTNFIARRIV